MLRRKALLAMLLMAIALGFIAKWAIESNLGSSRTGTVSSLDELPILDQDLPGLRSRGEMRYFMNRPPHGAVFLLVSGNATVDVMDLFIADGGFTRVKQSEVGGHKKDLLDCMKRYSDERQELPLPQFSMSDLLFYGHNSRGVDVLGAYRKQDGAFVLSIVSP